MKGRAQQAELPISGTQVDSHLIREEHIILLLTPASLQVHNLRRLYAFLILLRGISDATLC